uniref:Uncharacterized protein n=1 Tax=Rhinopithecus roxellana TaxID=61622 RepID=A0A2K6PNI2_RHIRO
MTPAEAACVRFSRYPMANFVITAQWLLPFCIKYIVKQTHLNNLLAAASFLDPACVLGEWLVQVLFLPSSLFFYEGQEDNHQPLG